MFIRFVLLSTFSLLMGILFLGPHSAHAAPPTGFDSAQYEDLNGDGRVDLIRIQVNGGEPLTNCTVIDPDGTSDWTYTGGSIGGTIGAISCTLPAGEIRIGIEGANLTTGHTVAPTISYNNDDGDDSIANASGVLGDVGPVAITDAAAPQITAMNYTDLDGDGFISSFFLVFSEELDPSSILRRSHLNFTNEGDFTGVDFGDTDTDLITIDQSNVGFLSPAASVLDTFDDSGELAFETVVGDGTMILTDGVNANTDAKAQTQASINDNARPVIASISPDEDATDINDRSSIVINFSEPMVTDFVENIEFSVTPAIPGAVWSAAWSSNNQTVTLTPSESFEYEQSYTVTIDEEEVNAENGGFFNDLLLSGPGDGVWTFTIEASSGSRLERFLRLQESQGDSDLLIDAPDESDNSFSQSPSSNSNSGSEPGTTSAPEVDSMPPLFEPGDLIRGESHSAVYLIDEAMHRRPFLHSSIFFTWFDSFEDVVFVPDAELAKVRMGSPVLPNPNRVLIQFESVNEIFVGSEPGILGAINETEAESLLGTEWARYVLHIPIVLWQQYHVEDSLSLANLQLDPDEMRSSEWLFAQ